MDNSVARLRKASLLSVIALAGVVALLPHVGGSARAASAPAPGASARVEHGMQQAVLAGGCFWGMEEVFEQLKGVSNVVAGYSGGPAAAAHYEVVSTGLTGHAESVQITYDPHVISYATLLGVYFSVAHDPTQLDRQEPDSGSQYRSSIFYENEAQHRVALETIRQLRERKAFAAPIVTKVVPLTAFYAAEAYHQHFAEHNPSYPYIVEWDQPRVEALHKRFPALVKG